MEIKKKLEHKKDEIAYEMNAVGKYIEYQECDDQLREAWNTDVRKLRKIEHILDDIAHGKHPHDK